MPEPTNRTPETAIAFSSLPYSVTLTDVMMSTTDRLWWKFTPLSPVYGVVNLTTSVAGNALDTQVYVGTLGALTWYFSMDGIEVPIDVPVVAAHSSYYFQVSGVSPTATAVTLTFQVVSIPVTAAPLGSIAINDDTNQFPLCVLSSTTGDVLQSFPFPAGETAAVLPQGTSLWHDVSGSRFMLYDPLFCFQRSVQVLPLLDLPGLPAPIGTDNNTLFYVGCNDPGIASAYVKTVSRTGSEGTTWRLPDPYIGALAPSRDNTVLYYLAVSWGASASVPVKRFNLGTSTALSDLCAAVSGEMTLDNILVLGDGSVVVPYRLDDLSAWTVRRYSATGTLLNSYTDATFDINKIAHAVADDEYWVWGFETVDGKTISRFQRIDAGTATLVSECSGNVQDFGKWQSPPVASPLQAHSESCPFIVTRVALPTLVPGDPGPGGGTGNQQPITYGTRRTVLRRLRRAPHISAEQTWLFHKKFQLDLQAGVGTNTGQGADPTVMLRWSDDGGHTWSDIHTVAAGKIGEYTRRALWRRLGRSRDRIYEVTVSDPVSWHLIQAFLDVEGGSS